MSLMQPEEKTSLKKENILIVDDDVLVLETMRDMLEAGGYRTRAVSSARKALSLVQEEGFDLLLTDIKMPEMDGLELVQELRRRTPEIVSILITGYASVATARTAIRQGVYDYLLKPFDRTELTAAVENALGRKRLSEENVRLKGLVSLLQVSRAVAASSEYPELLEFIVRTAKEQTQSLGGSILLFDWTTQGVTMAAALGAWEYTALIANRILTKGVASLRAEIGEGLLLTDRESHPLREILACRRLGSELSAPRLKGGEILLLPIEVNEEVIGLLSVCREAEVRPLTEGELELLRILAAEVSVALRCKQSLSKTEDGCLACLRSIVSLVEGKLGHRRGHMERVARWSRQLGRRIGLTEEELEQVSLAASLHDLGKIGLEATLLEKATKPEALSPEEQSQLRSHPVTADEMLAPLPFLAEVRAIIRHHHERWDGQGYPDGLAAKEITPTMHVVILANAYDNLTSSFAWQLGLPSKEALRKLAEGKGTQFDPEMADHFIDMIRAAASGSNR